jgi:hypothetical protein
VTSNQEQPNKKQEEQLISTEVNRDIGKTQFGKRVST